MQAGVLFVWAGAILVLCGVLFTAAKALGRGRLSEARPGEAADTLEPRGGNRGLRLGANWPGLALVGLGALLLLIGAVV
jgi:hypothetical protein